MTPEPPSDGELDQMQLALRRTYLAHERTLMAWIRTAASLITLGFTFYKFFFYLREQEAFHGNQLLGPRIYGMILIGIGVFMLMIATWQQRQQVKQLRMSYPAAPVSLSMVLAALIAVLGVLAFLATVFHE